MICPTCRDRNQTSLIYENGTMSTLVFCPSFYDEKGIRHHHDSNAVTTSYGCTNGHQWSERKRKTCWCGWTNDKET